MVSLAAAVACVFPGNGAPGAAKLKLKFGHGLSRLLEDGQLSALASTSTVVILNSSGGDGASLFSPAQVKLRGPLTLLAVDCIGRVVEAFPSVTSVKLARFSLAEGAAPRLAAVLCSAVSSRGAPLTIKTKNKGAVEPFDSRVDLSTAADTLERGILASCGAAPQ